MQLAKLSLLVIIPVVGKLSQLPSARNHNYDIEAKLMTAPVKKTISSAVLESIDVRVGTIRRVEDIKKSKNLVKLTVSFGDHERNIVAGLKLERENPQLLEGIQCLFVVNLEPKNIMGEQSEGMLFDIGYEDGITPVLALPEHKIPDGMRAC